jgi:hypothetical protein
MHLVHLVQTYCFASITINISAHRSLTRGFPLQKLPVMANEASQPLLFDGCHISLVPSKKLTTDQIQEVRPFNVFYKPLNVYSYIHSNNSLSRAMEQQ